MAFASVDDTGSSAASGSEPARAGRRRPLAVRDLRRPRLVDGAQAAAARLPHRRRFRPSARFLDEARTALARSDAPRALALTDDHARRFPHAELGEEREAIAIQALVLTSRYDDARSRAARFRASSPNSVFLPAVDESIGSIP